MSGATAGPGGGAVFDTRAATAWRSAGLRLPHRPGLDGLRAVAVLAVLGYHLELPGFRGGFLGVEVFFTLSGYLVTALLLVELRRTGTVALGRFARARARRLVPALLLCLLGTAAAVALLTPDAIVGLRAELIAALGYVQNWHLVIAEVPYGTAFEAPSPLLHLWSLAVEAQLYVLWPLVLTGCLAIIGRRRTIAVTLTLVALSVLATAVLFDADAPGRVYYGTDTRASGFLIGAALAAAWAGRPRDATPAATRVYGWVGTAGLAGLLVVFVTVSEFDERLYLQGGLAGVGLLAALVVAAAVHPRTWPARLLGAAPLVWLGRRSYGVYLYHWPVVVLSEPLTGLVPVILVDAGRVALTLLIASASYQWVELPVRRLARHEGQRRRSRRPDAVVFVAATIAVVMMLGTSFGAAVALTKSQTLLGGGRGALADGAPAQPDPGLAAPGGQPAPVDTSRPVLVVGDSVVQGSAAALRAALGPETIVDGLTGRQFSAALPIVSAWTARNTGPVVVHLGSNGTIRTADIEAVVAAAGDRPVVLVNVAVPRRWQQPDNVILADAVARHGDRVRLVDWAGAVAREPQLLGRDRVHPVATGRTALAEAVSAALGR